MSRSPSLLALPFEAALSVVVPPLAPALATPEALPPLFALARALPPIARGGFECRLAEGPAAVDLHQALRRSRGDHHVLAAFLTQRDEGLQAHPAWAALQRFAAWWTGSYSDAAQEIDGLFLEVDSDTSNVGHPAPSVFFKLGATGGVPADRAMGLVQELLGVLGLPAVSARQSEVFAVCADRAARITHIGAMLSRETRALRINVASGRAKDALALLCAVGWRGDFEAVERDAEWLQNAVGPVVCCLDVDADVHPHVGLECFIDEAPAPSGKWQRFLDALVGRGLCAPEKREVLLAFQRLVTPATSAVAWPDPLIVASLLNDAELFSAFACRLHHVKLTHAPGRPATAKGYLGFAHQWLGPDGRPVDDGADLTVPPSLTDAR